MNSTVKRTRKYKPYRRYKKYNYKKYYKKKQLSKIQSLTVKEPGVISPDRYFVCLRWTDNKNFEGAAADTNVGFLKYRANSPYDPNPTNSATDTSATGFYPMSILYFKYRVHSTSIRVSCCNTSLWPIIVLVWPSNGDFAINPGVSYANVQEMLNNAFCRWKLLSPKTGMDKCVIKNFISVKKLVGSKSILYEDSYAATVVTNLSNLIFWNIGVYTLNPAKLFDTDANLEFECRISYYTEFYERNMLIQKYGSIEDGNPAPNIQEGAFDNPDDVPTIEG